MKIRKFNEANEQKDGIIVKIFNIEYDPGYGKPDEYLSELLPQNINLFVPIEHLTSNGELIDYINEQIIAESDFPFDNFEIKI